jgi:hypothetical protein
MRGPLGNKYAVFCPKHTSDEVVATVSEMAESVIPSKTKKK